MDPPATVTGRRFFLYLILDLVSRKTLGFGGRGPADSEHALNLLRRTFLPEDLHTPDYKPGAAREYRLDAQGHH